MAGLFQLEACESLQQLLLAGLDLVVITSEIMALVFELASG